MLKFEWTKEHTVALIYTCVTILLAIPLVLVILLVLAGLLYKLELSEPVVDGGIIAAYVLSCCLGGFLMGKLEKPRTVMWGMIIGLLYVEVLFGVSVCMKQSSAQAHHSAIFYMNKFQFAE